MEEVGLEKVAELKTSSQDIAGTRLMVSAKAQSEKTWLRAEK